MNILPNKFILLDDKLQHVGGIPRVDAKAAIDSLTLAEGCFCVQKYHAEGFVCYDSGSEC